MCICKQNNWCRTWDETQNGQYPYSEHAPGCDEYKTEKFIVLEYGGTRCVIEPHEAKSIIDDSDEAYAVSEVMLTRDQYERMPEFQGF